MPRSSKLEPEVQALVDQAERTRLAIEALVDVVEPRQSLGASIETRGDGRYGQCNHDRFTSAGKDTPLWSGEPDNGWCSSADRAVTNLITVISTLIEMGRKDGEQRKLVWRKTPEVRSITTEIGDLFNANCRLSVVPANWIVSFPEDVEAPMDASHGDAEPMSPALAFRRLVDPTIE